MDSYNLIYIFDYIYMDIYNFIYIHSVSKTQPTLMDFQNPNYINWSTPTSMDLLSVTYINIYYVGHNLH